MQATPPQPVLWVEQSGRREVAHLGESVHFKLLEHLVTGVSALPRSRGEKGEVAPWGTLRQVIECWNVFWIGYCPRKQALF